MPTRRRSKPRLLGLLKVRASQVTVTWTCTTGSPRSRVRSQRRLDLAAVARGRLLVHERGTKPALAFTEAVTRIGAPGQSAADRGAIAVPCTSFAPPPNPLGASPISSTATPAGFPVGVDHLCGVAEHLGGVRVALSSGRRGRREWSAWSAHPQPHRNRTPSCQLRDRCHYDPPRRIGLPPLSGLPRPVPLTQMAAMPSET